MSANSVFPPFGFTTRADSREYLAGMARNELSECQSMLPRLNARSREARSSGRPSLPRLETSFMPTCRRLSSGLVMLPPRASSRRPKLRLNAICCSSVICWSRNTSTAWRSIPASMAATSSGESGLAMSTPDTSPTNTGWIWRMDVFIVAGAYLEGAHCRQRPIMKLAFPFCAERLTGLHRRGGAAYALRCRCPRGAPALEKEEFHGTHAARQGMGSPHGPDAAVRPDAAPGRPPPHPRGDDTAGLPDAQGAEARGAHARADLRHARPHHPDDRPEPPLRRPPGGGDGGAHDPEHEGVRAAALRHVDRQAGHRPRDRAGAGPQPAGHDHRLRRQPHLYARRCRRHRLRDRHDPGAGRA